MQVSSAPPHRPRSNQTKPEASNPMSRLRTALMHVTLDCCPFHVNLTAPHPGAQHLLNRARYREMGSDVHHTGEITMLHASPGVVASRIAKLD